MDNKILGYRVKTKRSLLWPHWTDNSLRVSIWVLCMSQYVSVWYAAGIFGPPAFLLTGRLELRPWTSSPPALFVAALCLDPMVPSNMARLSLPVKPLDLYHSSFPWGLAGSVSPSIKQSCFLAVMSQGPEAQMTHKCFYQWCRQLHAGRLKIVVGSQNWLNVSYFVISSGGN